MKALLLTEYGRLTVLINGDEEISSPGSRAMITKLASEHDFVLSHEGSSITGDKVSLATAVSKAVVGNSGFHAVSVFPSVKDGHPMAEVSLHKGAEWKTAVEKLD